MFKIITFFFFFFFAFRLVLPIRQDGSNLHDITNIIFITIMISIIAIVFHKLVLTAQKGWKGS